MSDPISQVIDEALAQGWQHDRTTRGHHQFFAPGGKGIVVTSGTPGDHRAFRNFMSEMKRRGFVMGERKRVGYGLAKRQVLAYLRRHENQEVSREDLRAYLRSVIPGIAAQTIDKNIRAAAFTEGVVQTPIGLIYRSVTMTTTKVVTEPHTKAPEASLITTPTIGRDEEERELDEALEALAKIERIIRRHKEIAKYLARIAKEIES